MNRNSPWRYLVVLGVLAVSLIYAAPNLYAPDPAVQITGQRTSQEVGEVLRARAEKVLAEAGIPVLRAEVRQGGVLLRFPDAEAQLRAKEALQAALGEDFVVALNLAPTTPAWLEALGARPMKLGLDLSGGVHFLLQVDTEKVVRKYLESQAEELKVALREARARYRRLEVDERGITLVFPRREWHDAAREVVRERFRDFLPESREEGDTWVLRLNLLEAVVRERENYAVEQNLTTLRNRVNELGVAEPVVQRQGRNRIVVELPGIQDTAAAKRIIGKTANLEFRLEWQPGSSEPWEEFAFRSDPKRKARLEKRVVITGDHVVHASTGLDENNLPQVNITLDGEGGRKMNLATRRNVGRNLGVVFIESRSVVEHGVDEAGQPVTRVVQREEKSLINLATIRSPLGVSFRITGLDSMAEAAELALLLRAGALAAPMYFVEESTIGPSLGAENIAKGLTSLKIGMALVVLFMIAAYRLFGLFADLALAYNLVLLVAVMSLLGATLTMPGMAGIVLTLGMAVDANVLIFSRIKEELKNGLSPQSAIAAGYDRAFVSILDANLTTLIVALILYAVGTGPVQGFAVVLAIGILSSMFTAITGTRLLVNLVYGGRRVERLWL
ncbi:MAG: protein translocase subunit SecD [Porticoccaceae bacterium]|nr:MAG: protein translocase subunit SecD [Porticoccaceae bacterium]